MTTGPTPPGHDGLLGTLAQMQQKIDNGIKNSGPNHVLCITRLGTDVTLGANVDTRPVTQWKPTAETDARGMYHYNLSGDTYWTIPFKGYWRVLVHSRFNPPSGAAGPVSTSVLLNGTDVATNAIGECTGFNAASGKCCYNTIIEDRVFARGDKVRVNFWSLNGSLLRASSLNSWTHVIIRYLGTE